MSKPYKLYGAEFSLYSGKARSYLRKKGIPFIEVNPSARVYKRFILPRTGVAFIPVVQTPDDQVIQDTSDIIDTLEVKFPELSVYPSCPLQKLVALMLEVYGDEWLVIPAMHYRWNFPDSNQPFVYQEFGKMMMPWLPRILARRIGMKVGSRMNSFVPLLGIDETTIPAVEDSYSALLDELNKHFSAYDYLLGDRPSIGDYGMIGPLYAHLYRDPYPGKMMRERAPQVARWVERMQSPEKSTGSFVTQGQVPASLLPVVRRMAAEQIPVLRATINALAQWKSENSQAEIPRSIGKHDFRMAGATGSRLVMPYNLWMWQRVLDHYHALTTEEQRQSLQALESVGVGAGDFELMPFRLARENNRLIFVD